jgi:beta-glucosidase
VLKGEWGFDGVVTSDWHAARSTAGTALAALDLAMPGPDGPWGGQLAAAVADGSVTADVLDDKVIRLLRLAGRVGALLPGGDDPPGPPRVTSARADLRPAVAAVSAGAAPHICVCKIS